ncbi:kinetochore Sim4 complex subunit Fta4 [Bombardia bombarda]|uniref:Kinetochore Sim4 complex subunit Fta4 n=1 Tax=Bombardia bombarda TaxID=252184 RepID=A0AA39XK95_9PEZI|nr:kinetochore Sim4 complex subunit Fta4 [Bombardia bombarda]
MAPPPTVVTLKQNFLSTQTRLLSQPLKPTPAWRAANEQHQHEQDDTSNSPGQPLPEKAIDDALFRLNHRLQQHARRVYPPQATRHVAEQIEVLYLNAAAAATTTKNANGDDGDDSAMAETAESLNIGADLADQTLIASLPPTWESESEREASAHPPEARRYAELVAQLQQRGAQRRAAAARVARLQRMRTLLDPFQDDVAVQPPSAADPDSSISTQEASSVQQNLVTRNGEVEKELQRMRVLLARVGGRVSQLREQKEREGGLGDDGGEIGEDDNDVRDVEVDEQRKVGLLLERF